jgi:hypothetical protein
MTKPRHVQLPSSIAQDTNEVAWSAWSCVQPHQTSSVAAMHSTLEHFCSLFLVRHSARRFIANYSNSFTSRCDSLWTPCMHLRIGRRQYRKTLTNLPQVSWLTVTSWRCQWCNKWCLVVCCSALADAGWWLETRWNVDVAMVVFWFATFTLAYRTFSSAVCGACVVAGDSEVRKRLKYTSCQRFTASCQSPSRHLMQ